jgi:outer membrane protein assembly factor BamE (lipoprotein component of BamABCDE complex)
VLKKNWFIRTIILGIINVFLLSCSQNIQNHGHIPLSSELKAIEVGVDTKKSVQELIGRPSTTGVLQDKSWYYVGNTMQHYGWKEVKEIKRVVVAIRFSQSGVVENIERFSLTDGQEIQISSRITGRTVKDNTFLMQLLGSFGRVDIPEMLQEK